MSSAAELLATRFLQPDRYEDRKAPSYWEILTEPRFYTDVLDALDTITAIGLGKENSGVRTAEAYLRSAEGKLLAHGTSTLIILGAR